MAVDDLPLPVVNFLNVIGVPWPYIDEDAVVAFGKVVREFARAVENTHRDATDAISRIADAHQASSTQAMSSGWAKMSTEHVYGMVDACHVLADALDVAAGYIVAQKAEAVAVLIGMAAAEPLFAKVEAAMAGLDWSGQGGAVSPADGFSIDPAAVQSATAILRGHAATMRTHADTFAASASSLGF